MQLVVALTVVRLLTPILVFTSPVFGLVLSLLLDAFDRDVFILGINSYPTYQIWDKLLDIYLFSVFFAYVLKKWPKSTLKTLAIVLYFLRLGGVLAFEVTGIRALLFFFPDLFDTLFVVYEIGRNVVGEMTIFHQKTRLLAVIFSLLFLKLLQEYLTHVFQKYPWELVAGQMFTNYFANIVVWSSIFLFAHVAVFWVSIARPKVGN